MNKQDSLPLCLGLLMLLCLGGCSKNQIPDQSSSTVTQFSTYDALAHGLYDGGMTLRELHGSGDFGLGTLHGWNGEVVILGGTTYLIDGKGAVSEVKDLEVTTPFLELTHFQPMSSKTLPSGTTYTNLQQTPATYLPTLNAIFAVKISGTFRHVKTRSMPIQSKPYKPMSELVKTQPTFEFENVRGTMVGFWSPLSMRGVSLSAWHLHFLTDDHRGGGHVLAFTTDDAKLETQETHHFNWIIPRTESYEREEFK